VMATLMLWTAAGLMSGSQKGAGVPWALSVLVKSNSALLGPIFLRLRSWRVLSLTGAITVALNLPYFAARPEDFRWFWNLNFGQYTNSAPTAFMQLVRQSAGDLGGISLARTVWLAFDQGAPDIPQWVNLAIVTTIVGITLGATFVPKRFDVIAVFATWSLTYFLVYSAWEHQYVMFLPAAALLVALRPQYRVLALLVFAFVALPTPYYLFQHFYGDPAATDLRSPQLFWPAWAGIVDHTSKVVPAFVLWGTLCWTQLAPAWRRRVRYVPVSTG